ncbi:MAG: NAD(P)H-dependent oxidoreductase [Alphaproteobacteria bacterium]|nr:NAD(P)H-dependent oxidoreductase [Alphaproteobacteria bacterium]
MSVLFINACVRSESRTHRLAEKVLQKLGGEFTEVNLEVENIAPLNSKTLEKRSKLVAEKKYDDDFFRYARQFAEAETIVVAAPFWDFSFPAVLKCYVEAISISGITFSYTEHGVQGLCKAKKLIYVATSGGFIPENNSGYGYFKDLATQLYGIKQTQFFKAEGLDIVGNDVEAIMQKALQEIDQSL